MKFDKIKQITSTKLNNSTMNSKKESKKQDDSFVDEQNLKEIPNNPVYWQNSIGIKKSSVNFGNKIEQDADIDKAINEIKSAVYYRELSNEDFHRQTLEELKNSPIAVKNYVCLIKYGIRDFYNKDKINAFSEFSSKIAPALDDFSEDDLFRVANQIACIVNMCNKNKQDIDKYIDIFSSILSKNDVPKEYKLLWLNQILSNEYKEKNPEIMSENEAQCAFEDFCRLCSYYDNNEDKMALSKANLSPSEQKIILEFFEDENVDVKNFSQRLLENIVSSSWQNKNRGEAFINALYEAKNDENKKRFLYKTSKNAMSYYLADIFKKFGRNLDFATNYVDFMEEKFKKISSANELPYFWSRAYLLLGKDVVNSDNFDSFREFIDKTSYSSLYSIEDYINPKTKLFDLKIYDKQKEFEKCGFAPREALTSAQEGIDIETGEFSPIAQEIFELCFPKPEEKTFKSKIRKIQTYIKTSSKNPARVEPFGEDLTDIFKCLKDKSSRFNKDNEKFFYDLVKLNSKSHLHRYVEYTNIVSLMNAVKNEDGQITMQKAKEVIETIKKSKSFSFAYNIYTTLYTFPKEKRDKIYSFCMSCSDDFKFNALNFPVFAKFCFDENGDKIPQNLETIKKVPVYSGLIYESDFLQLCQKYPNLQDFYFDIISIINSCSLANELKTISEKYVDENGALSEDIKSKVLEYSKAKKSISEFCDLYQSCFVENKQTNEVEFNEELYQKTLKFIDYCVNSYKMYSLPKVTTLTQLLNGDFNPSGMNFKDKVELLSSLKEFKKASQKDNINVFDNINKAIADIESSLKVEDISLPVKDCYIKDFASDVLTSKQDTFTLFEQILVNSIPLLQTYKDGLPLRYSRKELLLDLSRICSDKDKLNILSSKAGINPILEETQDDEIRIIGYNGIAKLKDLNLNNPIEKEIYDCLYRFLYENSVYTNDSELNTQINTIIKAYPEFINVIGKKQHATQDYSVDVHSLLVLAHSIKNPDYLTKLNPLDKSMLKITAIFHDIMKQEGIVDKGHQNLSSLYTRGIIKKIIKSEEIQDRVFELIDNHHWSEEYSNANDKTKKASELAIRFRRPNDFEIAKIIARSDLKAVSDDFYERLKHCLDEDNLKPIQENLDFLYSTGNAIFSDKIKNHKKLANCIQLKDGVEYKVINLHEIGDDEDMGRYGFEPSKKKKDLRFLVHMVDSHNIGENLDIVKYLSSPTNGGVLSESLISPLYQRTYANRKYGVLLSEINTNIINEANSNQGSGTQKEFSDVVSFVFGYNYARLNFKNSLLRELKINPSDISDDDYKEFYKNVLASKTSLSQIPLNKEYKIGKHKITGAQLLNAIQSYQDSLIDKTQQEHNEIVGYIPKINAVVAKAKSLDSLPCELLKFAKDNDFPILLI